MSRAKSLRWSTAIGAKPRRSAFASVPQPLRDPQSFDAGPRVALSAGKLKAWAHGNQQAFVVRPADCRDASCVSSLPGASAASGSGPDPSFSCNEGASGSRRDHEVLTVGVGAAAPETKATNAAISCSSASVPPRSCSSRALSSAGSVSFMLVSIQPGATALMQCRRARSARRIFSSCDPAPPWTSRSGLRSAIAS